MNELLSKFIDDDTRKAIRKLSFGERYRLVEELHKKIIRQKAEVRKNYRRKRK